jgi:hypothetical protein
LSLAQSKKHIVKYPKIACSTATALVRQIAVTIWCLNGGLLAGSQRASESPANGRPTLSSFSVMFFSPRANIEQETNIRIALHHCHAALPTITLKFQPKNSPPRFIKMLS